MPGGADATLVTVDDRIAPGIIHMLLEFMYSSGDLEPDNAEPEVRPSK